MALRYDRERADAPAPRVVAAGRGAAAERVLEAARRHGVAVREDPDLVGLLAGCPVGEAIPDELFGAVAEVLAWVYRTAREVAPPVGGIAPAHPPG